jgi:transposase
MTRHRHQEFIRFLNAVERAVPAGKVIHAIVDNYAAHKQPNVLKWLADHPRWTFHFTPTSASWLNAVEGFFSAITRHQIRRGAFHSVDDLQNAITRYIDAHNSDCRPFTWTNFRQSDLRKTRSDPRIFCLSQCTRCFVPDFDGAFLSSDSKDALWDRFFMGAPQRQSGCVPRQAFRGRHGV